MVSDTLEAVDTATAPRELNRMHDRCDKCRAQAFVIATKDDLELLFCGHHGKQHELSLVAAGWAIDDRTHLINETASPSANHED